MRTSRERQQGGYTTTHRKVAAKSNAKTSKKSKSNKHHLKSFFQFFASERMIQIYGVLFMLFAVLLLISIISYLFTHTADVKCVGGSTAENPPGNVAGVVGAYIAYLFVDHLFGLYSIGFCLLFFIIGLRITFEKEPLPILRNSIAVILTMSWFSSATGFFVKGTEYQYLAGHFGNFSAIFLVESTGKLVSVLIMLVALLIIAVLCYNFSLKSLNSLAMSDDDKELRKLRKEEKKREKREKKEAKLQEKKRALNREDTELSDLYITTRNELQDEYAKNVVHFDTEEPDTTNPVDKYIQENESKGKTKKKEEEEQEVPFEIIGSTLDTSSKEENSEENEDKNEDEVDDIFDDAPEVKTAADVEQLEDYDPRKDLSLYQFPPLDLLKDYSVKEIDAVILREELVENKVKIETTLKHFGISIKSITATIGPTVTLYEIVPAEGIRISKIKNLEDDIALGLAALGIRIIAPIPGKGTIGIEVPNKNPKIVSMREIIDSDRFQNNKFDLPIGLGKTISNEPFVVDLAKMPHLLMAGATGQGKSVGLNAIIASLLYKKHPSELKFVMIDPKKVEFSLYSIIENHYLATIPDVDEPIITDTKKVIRTLKSLCQEMDERYDLLKSAKTRNIKEYNAKFCARQLSPANGHRYLPYIILLIDEFGDLIMTAGREVEMPIARLAQLARAIGIHLIIATQRPSVNIITGTIKANFPARIAFRVSSKIDSRTILDGSGADQLIGKGDMLISTGSDLIRLQCAFVDTPEVENIVKHIEEQQAYPMPFLLPEVAEDEKGGKGDDFGDVSPDKIDDMFMDAASLIVQTQQGSTSLIQRKLSLGYNRAGRIMDQLEEFGVVGPAVGSKAREVKIKTTEDLREVFMRMGLL